MLGDAAILMKINKTLTGLFFAVLAVSLKDLEPYLDRSLAKQMIGHSSICLNKKVFLVTYVKYIRNYFPSTADFFNVSVGGQRTQQRNN